MDTDWNCDTCGKTFKSLLGLSNHIGKATCKPKTVAAPAPKLCAIYHFDGHFATCRVA